MPILDGYEKQNFVSDRMPMPVDVVSDTAFVNSISGETVQLYYWNATVLTADAGQAAGTVVIAKLAYTGILDALGGMIGNDKDTSLAWTTGTVLPAAKRKPCPKQPIETPDNATLEQIAADITENFANGEWCLDHRNGIIYGKKATTGTADTAAYKVMTSTTGGGTTVTESVNLAKYGGSAVSSTNPVYVKEVSAGTDVVVLNATGAAAISSTTAVAAEFKLMAITCHFSAAPTTSENFVIKLDATAGAAYDTTLYSVNPSLSAATDIAYIPDGELKFKANDEVVVTFTNTNARTYGLSVYYQLI
jgi:hypothetical protein